MLTCREVAYGNGSEIGHCLLSGVNSFLTSNTCTFLESSVSSMLYHSCLVFLVVVTAPLQIISYIYWMHYALSYLTTSRVLNVKHIALA